MIILNKLWNPAISVQIPHLEAARNIKTKQNLMELCQLQKQIINIIIIIPKSLLCIVMEQHIKGINNSLIYT